MKRSSELDEIAGLVRPLTDANGLDPLMVAKRRPTVGGPTTPSGRQQAREE